MKIRYSRKLCAGGVSTVCEGKNIGNNRIIEEDSGRVLVGGRSFKEIMCQEVVFQTGI